MSKDVLWEETVLEIFPAFRYVPIPTSECVRSGNNLFHCCVCDSEDGNAFCGPESCRFFDPAMLPVAVVPRQHAFSTAIV